MHELANKALPTNLVRVGVLIDEFDIPYFKFKILEHIVASTDVELALVIVAPPKDKVRERKISFFKRQLKRFDKQTVWKAYQKIRVKRTKAYQIVNSKLLFDALGLPIIEAKTFKKGKFYTYFRPQTIQYIQKQRIDVLLRLGFGILQGDILQACTYGVWSYHHGDEQYYRGGPAGFWEIMHRKPVTGAILQQLTSTLDGGVILRKGFFKTITHSYTASHNFILLATASWFVYCIRQIQISATAKETETFKLLAKPSKTDAPIYKLPSNRLMLVFFAKQLQNKIRFHYRELFVTEQWNVGKLSLSPQQLLTSAKALAKQNMRLSDNDVQWLAQPNKQSFIADPFSLELNNANLLLLEKYPYARRNANIVALHENREQTVISTAHHLSYPYTFKYENNWYCLPEQAASNVLRLYRYNADSQEFKQVAELLTGKGFVDASIVHYQKRFWIFCTQTPNTNTHLYIYYADSLWGPYSPHALNPVKIDVRASRPGGSFFVDERGQLIRPVQNCAATYGAYIGLFKIEVLTPTAFKETWVASIQPAVNSTYPNGLHTLSTWGNGSLIDGKRYIFQPEIFIYQLVRKTKRLLPIFK